MRNIWLSSITAAAFWIAAAATQQVRAENYCRELDLFCWPRWCFTCCPDVYCPKPMPCVPCNLGGTCRDCFPGASSPSTQPPVPEPPKGGPPPVPPAPTALKQPQVIAPVNLPAQ
jgi:hypothetical protein